MIQIDKTIIKNKYNGIGIDLWYKNILLRKIENNYKNKGKNKQLGKKRTILYKSNTKFINEIIIPFLSNQEGEFDEDLITYLLNGDYINEIMNNNFILNQKIWVYYHLSFFSFYRIEREKGTISKTKDNKTFIEDEIINILKMVSNYNNKINTLKTIHIELNISSNEICLSKEIAPILTKKVSQKSLSIIFKIICKNLRIVSTEPIYYYKKTPIYILEDINRFNEILNFFIDYSMMDDKIRHDVLNAFDIRVCPYCNRQFITSYTINNTNYSTSDLDHFLPKTKFSLFSLSLLNFVPACQICNSRMKLDKPIEILYPYREGFSKNTHFNISGIARNIDDLYNTIYGDKDAVNINNFNIIIEKDTELSDEEQYREQGTIKLFKLDDIYQSHKNYVAELVRTKAKYDEDNMLLMLKSTPKNSISTKVDSILDHTDELIISKEEKRRILYGLTDTKDEEIRKPLTKLTKDILNNL